MPSDTPRSTCVHPPETALASGLECLFLRQDYPATVVYSGHQRQNCTRILSASRVVRIIAAFKTHNS